MNKISVITVTYNNKSGLEKTIQSVKDQKEKGADIEYIVIDGNSSDGTKDLLNKNSSIFDIAISEPDKGIFNAMNKGLRKATGEAVVFLNAGDIFLNSFNLKEFQEKYDLANFTIFTHTIQTYEDLNFLRPKRNKEKYDYSDFGHQGVFASKKVYKKIPFHEEISIGADQVWQKEIWNTSEYMISSDISTVFELGGVSNNYSFRNLKRLFASPRPFIKNVAVIIKFFMQLFLGQRNLYKCIYKNKYDLVDISKL